MCIIAGVLIDLLLSPIHSISLSPMICNATMLPHRNDIASCHEKAYQALPLAEASRLLFFDNESEAMKFGQQVGSNHFFLVVLLL